MGRIWILGAPDPEMSSIEELLLAAGEHVLHAMEEATLRRSRVAPATAYRGASVTFGMRTRLDITDVYLVECGVDVDAALDDVGGTDRVVSVHRIDHHRPGDSGYGRPPSEYWTASSIGQVVAELTRLGALPTSVDLDALHVCAAADHCLAAAYRGECLGIDPDALMRWRVSSRARFQRIAPELLHERVRRAQAALMEAPMITAGTVSLRDMRTCPVCDGRGGPSGADEAHGYDPSAPCHSGPRGPVAELPEAAARLGVGYVAGPLLAPDGRRKITCVGSVDEVRAFLDDFAPRLGLVDTYGDPARGFAGGYCLVTAVHEEG